MTVKAHKASSKILKCIQGSQYHQLGACDKMIRLFFALHYTHRDAKAIKEASDALCTALLQRRCDLLIKTYSETE